jgi:hypothetical protein
VIWSVDWCILGVQPSPARKLNDYPSTFRDRDQLDFRIRNFVVVQPLHTMPCLAYDGWSLQCSGPSSPKETCTAPHRRGFMQLPNIIMHYKQIIKILVTVQQDLRTIHQKFVIYQAVPHPVSSLSPIRRSQSASWHEDENTRQGRRERKTDRLDPQRPHRDQLSHIPLPDPHRPKCARFRALEQGEQRREGIVGR